jgi:DNA-directed RNA polymerase subunit H
VIASVEIIKHELVPKHEILSAEEKEEVLKTFGATEKQLPKILISDPVIEMIGAKAGNVIRITRKSPTAGEAVYYRVVVEK